MKRALPATVVLLALVSLVPAGYPSDMTIPPKKDLSAVSFSERFVAR